MINQIDANEYLSMHTEVKAWSGLSEYEQTKSLNMAEHYINSFFELRDGTKEKAIYLHAVCEQAIHLIVFDKERLKLQREGVSSYKVDDISFQMNNSIISPIVTAFLKRHSYRQVGEIV